jgi:hypothetical protein
LSNLACVLADHLSNKSYPLLIFFGLEKKKKKKKHDYWLPTRYYRPSLTAPTSNRQANGKATNETQPKRK